MNLSKLIKFLENIFWILANRFIRVLIGVLTFSVIARYLGVDSFGELNYVISLVAIFGTISTLGLDGIVIREIVHNKSDTQKILMTAFCMRLAGALLAILLSTLSAFCMEDGLRTVVLVSIISLSFLPNAFDVIELWYQKSIQAKVLAKNRVITTMLSSMMKISLVFLNAPIEAFAIMQLVESMICAIGLALIYHIDGKNLFNASPSLTIAKRLVLQSWPLIVSGVALALFFRCEQIVIKETLGDNGLGLYYASVRIMELWGFLPFAVLSTIYPTVVRMKTTQPEAYESFCQLLYDVLTWLGVTVALLVTIAAPIFIPLVYGSSFIASVPVLIIHAWTAPVTFSASVRAQIMLVEDATIFHLIVAIIGMAIAFPMAIFLTRHYGVTGAALSLFASFYCTGFLSSFLFRRLQKSGFQQLKAVSAPFRIPLIYKQVLILCKS